MANALVNGLKHLASGLVMLLCFWTVVIGKLRMNTQPTKPFARYCIHLFLKALDG